MGSGIWGLLGSAAIVVGAVLLFTRGAGAALVPFLIGALLVGVNTVTILHRRDTHRSAAPSDPT